MESVKPKIVILVEPRVSGTTAQKVCDKLGFDDIIQVEVVGFAGGIWLLWHTSKVILT
ncbi:hypothetical protein LINPERPRIM_LOCUS14502 [Linum perenne]